MISFFLNMIKQQPTHITKDAHIKNKKGNNVLIFIQSPYLFKQGLYIVAIDSSAAI